MKIWHFTDKNVQILLIEAKSPFCKKKKGNGNFLLVKNIYTFLLWKKEERENRVELLQSCILYSLPSDLLLSLTTVLKGREWNFTMHWTYRHTSEKWLLLLMRTSNIDIKVSSWLALILLYIQELSWASYCNPPSFKTSTKSDTRYVHERIYLIM